MNATECLHRLVDFAVKHGLVEEEDRRYTFNRLLDDMKMSAPEEAAPCDEPLPPTVTPILNRLTELAAEKGLIADTAGEKELFATRLCGEITPHPAVVRARFETLYKTEGPAAATSWFYEMCRACDYIRVDNIARNVRFFCRFPVRRAGNHHQSLQAGKGSPRHRRAAQRAAGGLSDVYALPRKSGLRRPHRLPRAPGIHRIIPLTLNNGKWYLQYSPYLYYTEHCIVLQRASHARCASAGARSSCLFDFVTQFPHYMLGSNADLPIVGGSILTHDHFQGGNYTFPMDRFAPCAHHAGHARCRRQGRPSLDWPMTCIDLTGGRPRSRQRRRPCAYSNAWCAYSDPELRRSMPRPTARRTTPSRPYCARRAIMWSLNLVLRNNRTDAEHPLGIFHPHAGAAPHQEGEHRPDRGHGPVHPPRPPAERAGRAVEVSHWRNRAVTTRPPPILRLPSTTTGCAAIAAATGCALTHDEAIEAIHKALAVKCAAVLADAGVYKHTEAGRAGVMRFLNSIGYTEA